MTENDVAVTQEDQPPAPGQNSSVGMYDTKSEIDVKSKGEIVIRDFKLELTEDVRKSMVRDHSEILPPMRKSHEDLIPKGEAAHG